MEIKITIEKKYVWMLILTLAAVGLVVAYGGNNPSVMGHTLGEIQGADVNGNGNVDTADNSIRLGGKTGSQYISTACRVVTTNSGASREVTAMCRSNEMLMGGGCTPSGQTGIRVTRPEIRTGISPYWYCLFMDPNSEASAICCSTG